VGGQLGGGKPEEQKKTDGSASHRKVSKQFLEDKNPLPPEGGGEKEKETEKGGGEKVVLSTREIITNLRGVRGGFSVRPPISLNIKKKKGEERIGK